jgi:hypothetical protein
VVVAGVSRRNPKPNRQKLMNTRAGFIPKPKVRKRKKK